MYALTWWCLYIVTLIVHGHPCLHAYTCSNCIEVQLDEMPPSLFAQKTKVEEKMNIINPQKLQLLDMLGRGGFGAVFRGKWEARRGEVHVVAVKKCTMSGAKGDQDIPREVQILSSVSQHPHIISFYGISINYPDLFIVTEFAEKGSLFDYLHKEKQVPTVDQSLAWALHVAMAMRHLHNHDIIHRDLKSANILLSAKLTAKVCDFGTARYIPLTHNKADRGSWHSSLDGS